MQCPTATGIYIRNVRDAEVVLHAVALGLRPMVTRRLDEDERMALRSGCVYVWEQRSSSPLEATGQEIQRFTEGRSWGPSRAQDDFLIYFEKTNTSRSSMFHTDLIGNSTLVRQTYSVYVDSPRKMRKWHINAYYSESTISQLRTVDQIPDLKDIQVPEGRYVCARSGSRRAARAQQQQRNTRVDPSSSSSSSDPHSPVYRNNHLRLAPLEYLQMVPPRARDPIDDEVLRSFRSAAL
ncbi:Gti1/Pac2 family-domain-containing protein [Sparassis latifolia]|uniref:cAMP-independent regulatory protein pac2 n=1 Tax=Sparassis crispa TaxID=139825 RepID=A0A401GEC6_9APHY|nr:predicted protein [Sparassis crispa]GBE80475.1 predicted protein [Sparassis crispa]